VVLTLGAIATATAPAATLMVVRQYKAKGKVTDILLPVVALDDAVGLVVFAVSFGIARAIQNGSFSLISIVVNPLVEIVVSLLLGAIMGAVLTWIERFFNSNSNRLSLTIAFVVLTVALSKVGFSFGEVHVGFSPLLVCMMLGTIFCNICPLSEDLMERSDKWTAPLFVAFFVLSGAELELKVFTDVIIVGIGVAYILFRSVGKYLGAFVSTKISNCDPMIQKYLGITLLPQAGVALGMSVTAMQLGAAEGALIRNITLFAVMIYELAGPALTKWALTKSGDIQPKGEEVLTRRQRKLAAAEAKRKELEG
jgi:NhaP-type Na+/H+ or K+/H+ antiporter